jgi:hypothetical protein
VLQSLLDEGLSAQLDVEDTCRAFLDLAKAWGQRLVDMMYADAGGCTCTACNDACYVSKHGATGAATLHVQLS